MDNIDRYWDDVKHYREEHVKALDLQLVQTNQTPAEKLESETLISNLLDQADLAESVIWIKLNKKDVEVSETN